jgi:hypothetical protein
MSRPSVGLILAAALALVGLAGCAASPAPTPVNDQSPDVSIMPEVLEPPAAGTADGRLTCGGRTFPISALGAPTGAERAVGPEFDALRAALVTFATEFPGSDTWTWRLADKDENGALFVAEVDAQARPGWASVEVTAGANGWRFDGMGQCSPVVVLSAEFRSAIWILDPAFAAPASGSTELQVLVWERDCSSGSSASGRMSVLSIEYAPATVTIIVGVRGLGGNQTCPRPPGTPALLRLTEPLGARTLLDGGKWPPAPPSEEN